MHQSEGLRVPGSARPFQDQDHVVQFYESDDFLFEAVGPFLAEGLAIGQRAIVIAQPSHSAGIRARLTNAGLDVSALEQSGRLTILDARETLAGFMSSGMPDPDKFRAVISPVIQRSMEASGRQSVRAYGEMVDVLLKDGRAAAAIRLEQLWNELAALHAFSLLCGYSLDGFDDAAHRFAFDEVCRAHGQVLPTESYLRVDTETERFREIAYLQQRARALEREVVYRKDLERALREALAECERVEAERETVLVRERAARAEAEAANRLKDDFLAIVSHELRTPLNAIVGWAQVLSTQAEDEDIRARAVEVIRRNATLQQRVVNDLLDVSRIMFGKMDISNEPVDLASIVLAAAETVRPAAAQKALELELDLDEAMPAINGDSTRLQQIMWNLLSNAIKFTPEGGRVSILLARVDPSVHIVVSDTGEGIAADYLPHIFDRFWQADTSSTRPHDGLGLGLAVVRYLVEAHGGTVGAHSDGVGRGASITVRLPLPPSASTAA